MPPATADLKILLKLQDRATGPLQQSLGRVDKQAVKSTSNITKLGRTLRTHWIAATAVIAGMGFAFTKIVGSAIAFETAFAGVRKTVDATEEEFKELSDGLRKLSIQIPVTAIELANIQEIAGQLGVNGVRNLTKFTKTVAMIAVTTNLTREAAATNFARIANVMQEPLANIDRMGAAIVDLGNNFATTEAEIANFATRIAGASNVVGLSTPDIFAFGAAFSSVGVRAERGGTAVSKALILMATAVTEGGAKLKEFAEIAGLTSAEFIKAYEEDAAGAFALFIEGLGDAGLKGAAILKELELGDQRLVQAFLSVGGASGILTKALKQSNEAFRENLALNEEAEKRFATTASQIQIFKNNMTDLNIAMGEFVTPLLNKVLPALSAFFQELKGIDEVAAAVEEQLELEFGTEGFRASQIELTNITVKASADRVKISKEEQAKIRAEREKTAQKARETLAKSIQEEIAQSRYFFDFMAQTAVMAASANKEFAILAKAASIGQAIMNTAVAVTKAYTLPFPANLAVASLMASLGAAQVAIIAGQEFHKGGPVKAHGGLAVDEVPIIAQTGEGVLSRRGMSALGGAGELNRLNTGGGGGSTISISMENVSFRSEEDIEDVMERLSNLIIVKTRSRI